MIDDGERSSEAEDVERVHVHCIVCGAVFVCTREAWDRHAGTYRVRP
jgi:hypothetical protein